MDMGRELTTDTLTLITRGVVVTDRKAMKEMDACSKKALRGYIGGLGNRTLGFERKEIKREGTMPYKDKWTFPIGVF